MIIFLHEMLIFLHEMFIFGFQVSRHLFQVHSETTELQMHKVFQIITKTFKLNQNRTELQFFVYFYFIQRTDYGFTVGQKKKIKSLIFDSTKIVRNTKIVKRRRKRATQGPLSDFSKNFTNFVSPFP